ncbi:helix-turn-helix domain-containing protein [Mediterraneibacter glycyrrhizinilyticus]|uniref:helix-turn-helix domain-containing protein n=1 Tax=Mediterraneibacter glycyrrhizinilyticus TaxID=342942 RepID=UPI001961FAE4|nr:helix-turn-helix domain-containing protein [Mediterraneibacter glycyrrhizinilyticus]MBM6752940.1 helix-turn-helix domain-containing protein [Mediterraneibacter glycyrrhizinilyticus]
MFHEDISDLITVDELCEWLAIGKNAAYTLLNSGKIKAFRIGRIWKISKAAVVEYIRQESML